MMTSLHYLIVILLACTLLHVAAAISSPREEEQRPPRQQDSIVAFSAVCNETINYLPNISVYFDQVISNEGDYYLPSTGQFFCPDDAVYLMSWGMSSGARSEELPGMRVTTALIIARNLVKDGPKTNVFEELESARSTVAEMSSLVECVTFPVSHVSVAIQAWDENNSPIVLYEERSSFSGFRLGLPSEVVGFVAELSEETLKLPGDLLRFDKVLSNYGNAYNAVTGAFTCPDNATYAFSVSAHTRNPDTPWSVSRLVMGEEEVLLGPVTYKATPKYDSGSSSVTSVTRCQAGKLVYVQSQQASNFLINSYAPTFTSFTGFRLYNNDQEERVAVAFMAVLDADLINPMPDTPITMRRVLTNIGNAYDSLSGSFICPDDQYYMFSFSTVTDAGTNSGIYMDDQLIRRNRNNRSDPGDTSGSATASVILQCVPGSRVYPRHVNVNDRTYLADHCSFSGYKLPGQNVPQ